MTVCKKIFSIAALLCAAFALSCNKVEEEEKPSEEPYVGIKTYADFRAFAEAVNSGESVDRFCNDAGEVVLVADIDMSESRGEDWIPVGNPEKITDDDGFAYAGQSFKGVFNGQGHSIKNFAADVRLREGKAWGLFGLADGATIKNVMLGASEGDYSQFSVKAAAAADFGVLVGTAIGNTSVMDCENHIPVRVLGNDSNARMTCGGLVGSAVSVGGQVCLSGLKNYADIEADSGENTGTGASCVMAGGIVGFCSGEGGSNTIVENCENTGNISGSCGRSSGITASMHSNSIMRYCINRGNVTNGFADASIGGLTCIMGSGCSMDDCINYGDIVTSATSTKTGGMVGVLNRDDVVLTGGGNYGKVIGANTQYHGLIAAYFSKFSSVKGVYVGGACGTYSKDGNHSMHNITKDNWLQHIGVYSNIDFNKITDLSSAWGEGGGTGSVLPELKDASLRVFFIGNSFTMDAVTHLPGICYAAGATDITMAHLYYGGRTIPQYYTDRSVANNTLYYANPGAKTFTTFSDKASIEAVAKSGRWDVVTIQEHTGTYCAWIWNDAEKNAIENLISFVVGTQSKRPKVFYIMSQAYHDNGQIGSSSQGSVTWANHDHQAMFKVIAAQGKKVLEETAVDDIIATGTMLENLRTSEVNNDKDLTRDGFHLDYGLSRYGAACTVFEKVVQPATGKTLEGNSFRYTGTDPNTTVNVTDENAPIARLAAHYAVEKPFEITSMGGEVDDDDDDPSGDITLRGKGTASDPYLIATASDMQQVGPALVENEAKYFEMTSDIDMSSISDWTPVNMAIMRKDIHFDGKGHKISGFTCTNKTYTSLFGLISGSVKNLVIDKPVVTSSSQLGVLATWLGINDGSYPVEISNVDIIDATVNMTGTNKQAAGILAANCGGATVTDCSVSGTISNGGNSSAVFNCVGGVIGRIYASSSAIRRCSFSGSITSDNGNLFGGIVGSMSGGVPVIVEDCFSQGTISTQSGGYIGGIIGEPCQGSTIKNCYSTMALTGFYCIGGIVGRASDGKNPATNATVNFNTDLDISITGCIAWNPSITSTNKAAETPASHYSSGAVVGFTVFKNTLANCWRRPDIAFNVYMDSVGQYNTLTDTPDCGPNAPYVKESGTPTYLCPYHGKAAASGATVSSVARSLGWSTSVWDLDGSLPVLK